MSVRFISYLVLASLIVASCTNMRRGGRNGDGGGDDDDNAGDDDDATAGDDDDGDDDDGGSATTYIGQAYGYWQSGEQSGEFNASGYASVEDSSGDSAGQVAMQIGDIDCIVAWDGIYAWSETDGVPEIDCTSPSEASLWIWGDEGYSVSGSMTAYDSALFDSASLSFTFYAGAP
jgi:hypothetical protein